MARNLGLGVRSLACAAAIALTMVTFHASAQQGASQGAQQGSGGYIPAPSVPSDNGYLREAPVPAPAPSGYMGNSRPQSGGYLNNKSAPTTDTFVPATAESRENINGGTLMLIAYAGFWLLMLGYVVTLASRARTARREADELKRQIGEIDDRLEDLEAGRV